MGRECYILFYGEKKRVGVRYGGSFFHRDARRDNVFNRMFATENGCLPVQNGDNREASRLCRARRYDPARVRFPLPD